MSDTYNPEAGLPVTGSEPWEHPDVMGRMWFAGEIHAALTGAGFKPYPYDVSMQEPCRCVDDNNDQPLDDCAFCNGEGTVPLVLRRNKRWVHPDGRALRVPNDPGQVVSPYLGACASALLA